MRRFLSANGDTQLKNQPIKVNYLNGQFNDSGPATGIESSAPIIPRKETSRASLGGIHPDRDRQMIAAA